MYKFVKLNPPFDITKNFWDENFQLSLIEPFKKLYDRDTTPDKSVSSKEMWALWLECNPDYENKVYRLPPDQKRSTILYYHPTFDYKDEVIQECLSVYDDLILTSAARAFKVEESSLIKRAKFLEEAEYTFPTPVLDNNGKQVFMAGRPVFNPGTAKDIDMMRKSTATIVKEYEKAKKVFEEEQKAERRIFGGGRETALDKGYLTLIEDED